MWYAIKQCAPVPLQDTQQQQQVTGSDGMHQGQWVGGWVREVVGGWAGVREWVRWRVARQVVGGAVVIHGLACVYKRLQLVYVAMVTAPVLVVIGQQEYLFRSRDMQVSEHPANQQPNLGSLAV